MEPNTIPQTQMAPQVNVMNPTGVDPNAAMAQMGELSNRRMQNTLSQRQTAMQQKELNQRGQQFQQNLDLQRQQMQQVSGEAERGRQHDVQMEGVRHSHNVESNRIEALAQLKIKQEEERAANARARWNQTNTTNMLESQKNLDDIRAATAEVNRLKTSSAQFSAFSSLMSNALSGNAGSQIAKDMTDNVVMYARPKIESFTHLSDSLKEALPKLATSPFVEPVLKRIGDQEFQIVEDPNHQGTFYVNTRANRQGAGGAYSLEDNPNRYGQLVLEKDPLTNNVYSVEYYTGKDGKKYELSRRLASDIASGGDWGAVGKTIAHPLSGAHTASIRKLTKEELRTEFPGLVSDMDMLPNFTPLGQAISKHFDNIGMKMDPDHMTSLLQDMYVAYKTKDPVATASAKAHVEAIRAQNRIKDQAGNLVDNPEVDESLGEVFAMVRAGTKGAFNIAQKQLTDMDLAKLASGEKIFDISRTDLGAANTKSQQYEDLANMGDEAFARGILGDSYVHGMTNFGHVEIPNMPKAQVMVGLLREMMGSQDNMHLLQTLTDNDPNNDFEGLSENGQKIMLDLKNSGHLDFVKKMIAGVVTKGIAESGGKFNFNEGSSQKAIDDRIAATANRIEDLQNKNVLNAAKSAPPIPDTYTDYDQLGSDIDTLFRKY